MTDMKYISYALCFNCASVYKLSNKNKLKCPYCKHCIDIELYKKILSFAKTAVHFGYVYRKKYEEQIQTADEIKTVYCLPDPSAVACFIGVAALSGIIGGAAYDTVKKVISKIMESSKKINQDKGKSKIKIQNDDDIRIIFQYTQEFYTDTISAVDEVKYHIEKERFIHLLTEKLTVNGDAPSKKEIQDAVSKAYDEYRNCKKPSAEDFNSFWNDIDKINNKLAPKVLISKNIKKAINGKKTESETNRRF